MAALACRLSLNVTEHPARIYKLDSVETNVGFSLKKKNCGALLVEK